jgi:ATP-dependent Lhr-like helicase
VVLVNGVLAAYIGRGARQITAYIPDEEPARSLTGRALARRLAGMTSPGEAPLALLIAEINGAPVSAHPLAAFLVEAGFSPSAMGFQLRRHA